MPAQVNISAEFKRVLMNEGQAILACAERLDRNSDEILEAVRLFQACLERGGKIVITGVGKSGKIGQKIASTLCSTGSLAVFIHPTEGLHGDIGLISRTDAVLAMSQTGNTEELLQLLPSLKSMGIPTVALCGNRHSRLANDCDAFIDSSVEQEACPHNLAPTTSTTLALALGDALAITLMQLRGFDSEKFAQNHPGGSLGRRLKLKVADIMHRGNAVATLAGDANVDDVVVALTQKNLGAVLIVDGPKLSGIVVEADIRRALRHREKFFNMKASEIMTRDPVVARPEMLAKAALDLMENRPNQINVLPVVTEDGQWQGLVRLHDLAQVL